MVKVEVEVEVEDEKVLGVVWLVSWQFLPAYLSLPGENITGWRDVSQLSA